MLYFKELLFSTKIKFIGKSVDISEDENENEYDSDDNKNCTDKTYFA